MVRASFAATDARTADGFVVCPPGALVVACPRFPDDTPGVHDGTGDVWTMRRQRIRWTAREALVATVIGMLVGASAPAARATQMEATPAIGPCAALVAGGTPAVEHAPLAPSAFDPNSPEQSGETGNAADFAFDLFFIDAMVLHHQGAVAMAEIASTRSERPEILDIAAAIDSSQRAEIEQLLAWREAWFPGADPVPTNVVTGLSDEGMMTGGAMGGMGHGSMAADTSFSLGRLCGDEGPFDLAFLEEMIPHHQSAAGMAKLAEQRAEHDELKTLAAAIIVAQETEIARMTTWLAEWYPQDGSSAPVEGTPNP